MAKGVGVYLGRNEAIAVSVVRTSTGPQIKNYAIELINPETSSETSPETLQEPAVSKEAHKLKKLSLEAQAIYKALEKIKEPKAYVTAAISPFQVVSRHFIMPMVPKKEETEAVRYEASRYIPFKLTDSVLDYSAQLTHKNVFSVTATAMRQEILEGCLENLHAAGARVLMVEPVYCAVGRAFSALNMIGQANTHGFVVVQSDGNVNVTFASKGVVYLSRDFLLSGNIEEDKNRFHEELKASIDYFYKLTGGDSVTQIFLAGRGDLKFWVEYLEHVLNYTIRFDVANFPNEKNIAPDILSTILVAYGLALQGMNYKSPLGDIKLLPKENRVSPPQHMVIFLGLECAVLLFCFFLAWLIVLQPQLQALKNQENTIFQDAKQKYPAFGQQALGEIQQRNDGLTAKTGQLRKFFGEKVAVSGLFSELGRGLPQSVRLDYVSYEDMDAPDGSGGRKKRFSIRGICYLGNAEKETDIVNGWVKALSGKKAYTDNFSEIKLEESKREKYNNRDVTRFRIVCE